jgi:hypothetical protein
MQTAIAYLEDGLELGQVRVGAEEGPLDEQLPHDAPDTVGL